MFFNVMKAKHIVDLKDVEFEKQILLSNNDSSLNIIALKKNEIINTHTSLCDAAVYVIEGEIEIQFASQNFKIDKGEILLFTKDTEHSVIAHKDSKFFVIKI